MSQHVASWRPNAGNMLLQKLGDMHLGAHDNVANYCIEMLRSFGRSLRMPLVQNVETEICLYKTGLVIEGKTAMVISRTEEKKLALKRTLLLLYCCLQLNCHHD